MMKISRLGFGLSSIAGSGNFAHQERLVRTAIDHGITHFDVAPYYGSGDAEGILGRILAKCPEPVTVTTKFGLTPLSGGRGGSMVRTLLRPVFRHAQFLKKAASAVAKQQHQPATAAFVKGSLLKSVDESLVHLGRPLDILLLHDPSADVAVDDNLLEELTQVKQAGKVHVTGLSGHAAVITTCLNSHPGSYSVAQLENSLTQPAPMDELHGAKQIITHRAIQGGLEKLTFLLDKHPKFRQVWERDVAIELAGREQVAHLLLQIALADNPTGSVLFSTVKPERVRSLAALTALPLLSSETIVTIKEMFCDIAAA